MGRKMKSYGLGKLMITDKDEVARDLTGCVFDRLTVIKLCSTRNKSGDILWVCLCKCSKEVLRTSGSIIHNTYNSCGCYVLGVPRGENSLRIRKIWRGMIDRCYKTYNNASKYRKNNIQVCDEWKNNYFAFKDWAFANGYKDDLTIDRFPNKKGNYEPSNCRWATYKQQANNTSSNVLITYNGETKTICEWAEHTGFPRDAIYQRIRKLKWSIDDALTIKPNYSNRLTSK